MRCAPQSSPCLRALPAWICALGLALAPSGSLAGQAVTLRADTPFLRDAATGATVLGTFPGGTRVTPGTAQGNFRQVRIDAWIFSRSLAPTTRDGFDLTVTPVTGENIRRTPNGPVLARAAQGALFSRVSVEGAWTRVRRDVWISVSALPAAPTTPPPSPAPDTAVSARVDSIPPGPRGGGNRVTLAPGTRLRLSQGGEQAASVLSEIGATTEEHAGDWVRVRLEGWVRREDLIETGPAEGPVLAELRANPERFVGQTVQWRLQFLAFQTADALRREMPEGQPYLLTRGPLPEVGFVYVMVPPALVSRFREMAPLTEIAVEAVIRSGRSRYLPNPVVELVRIR